ncbi:NADH-quinone oxidoreductase subunit B family protein [Candidatus Woesearchaeota archaeon]|nr:NADH-quinone oxidoreductase subunit B family protein [Candidatus Woesearchaeota archaeon]
MNAISNIFRKKITETLSKEDLETKEAGMQLKKEINTIFGRSLSIREVDAGSDNATEIELVNLTTPHYDAEQYGIAFVASPRHADAIIITGAVTINMAEAVKKVYEATPHPKLVIAVGDDACNGGILKGSYATLGGAEAVLPIDWKIPGNPPSPKEILKGLLALMQSIRDKK